ncbi:MAG: hypothetical protein HQ494_15870 [Rhodospirillales bacterium]|nr:hypothetical protein [Rhodospirillales bacterium]
MIRLFSTIPHVAIVLLSVSALALGACGDEEKGDAKKSANALTDFYYTSWKAPSADWEVRKVRPGKESDVTVEAKVVTKTLTKKIMERSRMEQMEIARMVCPDYTDKIWTKIEKKHSVGVVLSGSGGHIINALCKRP